MRDLEKRLKQVKQQLDHADNNSYARLREEFSQQDVDRLMRLFNGALFSLPLGDRGIELDDSDVWVKTLEAVLDSFKGERFEAPGLSIDLSHIDPPALQALADRAALRDQKERLEKNSSSSRPSRQSPPTATRARPRPRPCTNRCSMPRRPGRLPPQRNPERRRTREDGATGATGSRRDELKRSSDAFTERVQQLSAKLQLVGRQIADLEAKQRTLDDALRRRQLLPADLPFGTPFMEAVDDSMDNLLPLLNDYRDSWQALQRVDNQIEALYAQVRLKGVAKFDSEDDMERRLQLLINAYSHRTEEALTLAKARRAAVTDIARTLRNIRSDYDSLEHQLALFNREINRRQVSNTRASAWSWHRTRKRSSTSTRSSTAPASTKKARPCRCST